MSLEFEGKDRLIERIDGAIAPGRTLSDALDGERGYVVLHHRDGDSGWPQGYVDNASEEIVDGRRIVVCVGSGGVGKTTISALLARSLAADQNNKVIAIDADPVANLAAGLGIDESEPITPIAELRDLIAERTGAEPGTMGGFFTLNHHTERVADQDHIDARLLQQL